MDTVKLESIAQALVKKGKGILAADESSGTIKKRFDTISVNSTEQNRFFYRHLLFTTDGIEDFISGVILFDETIRQSDKTSLPLPEILNKKGILPGIKVDKGAKDMPGFPEEKYTEGLDDLRPRLVEYQKLGAHFAKWRSVITIGETIPSIQCIKANAHGLALYAAYCQDVGLVPIVEPEILMEGTHTIKQCEEATAQTLKSVFYEYLFEISNTYKGPLDEIVAFLKTHGKPEDSCYIDSERESLNFYTKMKVISRNNLKVAEAPDWIVLRGNDRNAIEGNSPSPTAKILREILSKHPYSKIELNAPAIRVNNSYDMQIHLFRSPSSADKVVIYKRANH